MYELNAINLSAMNAYSLRPFSGRVTLFKASVPSAGESRIRATPTMGWDEYATEVEVVPVPGDHFDFLGPQHLSAFADRLAEELVRADAAHVGAAR
jgi:thioesterase domain-containing protein